MSKALSPVETLNLTSGELRDAKFFHSAIASAYFLLVKLNYLYLPPASLTFFNFQIGLRFLLAIFIIIPALLNTLVLIPGISNKYYQTLRQGKNYIKWVEFSITSSILFLLLGKLSATPDWLTLILILINTTAYNTLAIKMEIDYHQDDNIKAFAGYFYLWATQVVLLSPIFFNAVKNFGLYGLHIITPIVVPSMLLALGIGYLMVTNQYKHLSKTRVENTVLVMSLVLRIVIITAISMDVHF